MATAKRRINSTDRKRIGQESVEIRLLDTPPGAPQRASASLDLSRFSFPETAEVAVEAYRSSSLMRFPCGTVSNLNVPPQMVLDEIDAGGNVQFRVKVIDRDVMPGRLLGVAARIRPKDGNDDQGRRSLLKIRWDDLGPELWNVSVGYEEDPALCLNIRATGLDSRIIEDPMIRGIVMPAAFRIVLEELIKHLPVDDEDQSDWKNDWLRFCREELEIEDDPAELDSEARTEWVTHAVRVFAGRAEFLDQVRKAAEGEKK